jgi:hypothetical protein
MIPKNFDISNDIFSIRNTILSLKFKYYYFINFLFYCIEILVIYFGFKYFQFIYILQFFLMS